MYCDKEVCVPEILQLTAMEETQLKPAIAEPSPAPSPAPSPVPSPMLDRIALPVANHAEHLNVNQIQVVVRRCSSPNVTEETTYFIPRNPVADAGTNMDPPVVCCPLLHRFCPCPPRGLLASLITKAALDSPVYRYLVTHTPSGPVNTSSPLLPFPSRFSFHCLDAVAFFGGLELVLVKRLSDEDRSFQDLIRRHFVSFAKTGKIEADWPEYPIATALLSHNLTAVQSYSVAQCELWKQNGLFAYAWMN